jgi:membrane protein implicated in regulation of membrane protease activity
LVGVVVGWIAWFFAHALEMPTAAQFVVLVLVAVVTYVLLTAVFGRRPEEPRRRRGD